MTGQHMKALGKTVHAQYRSETFSLEGFLLFVFSY